MGKICGMDVSYAQGSINWEQVKASKKIEFAILRAGYGRETSQVDTQFERNYAACKRLGIPVGVYWYSYATTAAEAEQEAKVCLQTIRGKQFEYPVAFDIEEARSLPQADALCTAFCNALEKQGYYAAIYTFKSALENNISAAIKSRYDIFLSHVGVQQTSYAGAYGLWQYSWTGRIPGISGDVDLDYAYKDYPTMIQNAGLNGFSKILFSVGTGSMIGGLISASGISKPKQTLPFYSALLCGLCLIIISQTNSLYPALLLYAGIGFTAIISIVNFNTIIQFSTERSYLGRIMSLYALVFLGATPFGSLIVSSMIEYSGTSNGLLSIGLLDIMFILLIKYLYWK